MKNLTSSLLSFVLLAILFSTSSCGDKCVEVREFVQYNPVYIDQAEYDRPVSLESAREIENPGVIASYGSYLYINEYNQGIHMINNADPSNPINEGFISINNNKHFSIKDGIVLANRYADLVSIDIRQPGVAAEIRRTEQVFPDEAMITDEGIVSHYEISTEVLRQECEDPWFGSFWMQDEVLMVQTDMATGMQFSAGDARSMIENGGSNVSTNSSTTRFTITKNHLYVLGHGSMEIFNVANAEAPQHMSRADAPWDGETLFPLNDFLFVGAQSGMHIYALSSPTSPTYVSGFEHAFACDPVVANESNAYVTLRSGNTCNGFTNQMDVINIENIEFPQLIGSHNLENPRGLTLLGDYVLVCDDHAGVVIFNIANPQDAKIVGRYTQNQANDILPVAENIVVVAGEDGIYELDLSNIESPELLSFISSK